MDAKQAALLARLRETFRDEAAEHLEEITRGLLALEQAGADARAPLVERVFREAHSLKGAARAVDLRQAETRCEELESTFAAMKRGTLLPSPELLDTLHAAVRALSTLCAAAGNEAPAADADVLRVKQATDDERPGGSAAPPRAEPSTGDMPPPFVSPGELAPSGPVAHDTVRIATHKLNAVMGQVEELLGPKLSSYSRAAELRALAADLARWNDRRSAETARFRRANSGAAGAAQLFEAGLAYSRSLEHTLLRLARSARAEATSLGATLDRLFDEAKTLLVLPCSSLLNQLPPVVRELAREQGKQAELNLVGEDIELDRRILDELKAPLIHLLRNAVDHGIEPADVRREGGKPQRGVITVATRALEGRRLELTVTDDGAGVDLAKIQEAAQRAGLVDPAAGEVTPARAIELMFQSGLSTSASVGHLSGRGLGLAIVREKVETLGGTISVTSTPGEGTSFCLVVPVSRATFRGVIVIEAGQRFIVPTSSVRCVVRVRPDEIHTVGTRQTIKLGERALPLVRVRDVLEIAGTEGATDSVGRAAVVVSAAHGQVAFLVDEVVGEQEVMVKSLGPQLPRVRNIAGAALTGTGALVLILSALDLVESARHAGARAPVADGSKANPEPRRNRVLVVEDSITARTLVAGILEAAGYEVTTAVDGLDAYTRLKNEPVDLVVSDIDMPRMNGLELTARVRADADLHALPVVLVTALASPDDRERGLEAGANAYVVKSSFDQSNLIDIVQRLL